MICSVCSATPAPASSPRLEADPELPRDEDEVADADRLVVRRALERPGRTIGADRRPCRPSGASSRSHRASAMPSALKIADRTCCESSPSISRTWIVRPAASRELVRGRSRRGPTGARPRVVAERSAFDDDERPAGRARRRPSRAPRPPARCRSRGRTLRARRTTARAPRRAPRRRARPPPRARRARSRASSPNPPVSASSSSRWSRTATPVPTSACASAEVDLRGACALHSSVRSIAAPRSRRRSSMRS